ncbi:hypothetical protein SDC9_109116 [bioreactor metagenome]|uniref:Glycosyltransferase RgtA/B/C/D-like domain-containing protein n=1 Tax=bioreactor metagenome TaxID=1076179 RepID=A0A645B9U3_9ZZZZ
MLCGSILLAWIIRQSEKEADKRHVYRAMLAVIALYLLNPVNLYASSQHNFSEIWGQFFLIVSLSAWVFYLQSDRVFISRILLFVSVALLAATDWMGLTFMAALILVYFRQMKKAHIRYGVFLVSASVVVTMSIICLQYVSIAGSDALIRSLGIRYLERSGFFGGQYTDMGYDVLNPETWFLLLQQIHNVMDGTGYIVLALFVVCLVAARKICTPVDLSVQKIAFWTALLFFVAVLSASSIHYIYTARFTPFLALAGAALFAKISSSGRKIVLIIAVAVFLMHVAAFRSVAEFQKRIPETDEKQAQLNAAAQIIRENKLDSIPLTGNLVESDIIYLSYKSQRNLVWEK